MTNFHDQMHIDDPSVLARTMFVDTGSVKATDFDIDEATQETLFASGRKAATKFLAAWDFEEYVDTYRSAQVIDLTGRPVPADVAEDR
jgi:NTE family protein